MLRVLIALCISLGALALSSPGWAQSRSPFAGPLGAAEIALPPEEALQQHQAMQAALDQLAPQRPGQQDVYVIAAGLWGDPVFESEASRTAAALARSLGAEGRTLVLAAGQAGTPRRFPAASPSHLQIAFARVGQLIDPQEDLVVIFLTSHGGPAGMSLREARRLDGNLSPFALSASLSSAGISRRVVILSACFSGVFVPALANDDTIVMTAAARDRQSFGCQPEREWTYFGDAVVNQGLMAGKSLLQSFEDGVALINTWEQRDNFTPSNPQRHIGSQARTALEAAEAAARR